MFAFVQGTDPEVLLLLEAVRTEGDLVGSMPSSSNRADPTQPEIYVDVQPRQPSSH